MNELVLEKKLLNYIFLIRLLFICLLYILSLSISQTKKEKEIYVYRIQLNKRFLKKVRYNESFVAS